MYAGRSEDGLRLIDKVIEDALRWDVNHDAFAAMHHTRACMLHQLGRADKAASSMAIALSIQRPGEIASLHLCTGNKGAAKRVLIEALKKPLGRENVIAFMQKHDADPVPAEYTRKLRARALELSADPVLRAAVLEHGRILEFSQGEGAPPERN
jgi:hypothetical protein